MTYAGTYLPLPVLQGEYLDGGTDVEALVAQLTAVGPVLVETGEETECLIVQQVVGVGTEVVEADSQAVVDEATLKADIEAACGLPLHLGITDTVDSEAGDGSQELLSAEIAAGSEVVDVVVTADVVASRQTQVVDTLNLSHPGLVGHHPRCLHAGEDSPCYASQLEAVSILTEARRALGGEVSLQVVAAHEVVLGLGIPCQRVPGVIVTSELQVLVVIAHERRLVTTGIIT